MFLTSSPSQLVGSISKLGIHNTNVVIAYIDDTENWGVYRVTKLVEFTDTINGDVNIDQLIDDVCCLDEGYVAIFATEESGFTEGNAERIQWALEDGMTELLDAGRVDWDKGTWYSLICGNAECCDPENPKSFNLDVVKG